MRAKDENQLQSGTDIATYSPLQEPSLTGDKGSGIFFFFFFWGGMESHSVAQDGGQWVDLGSVQTLSPWLSNPPASAS